MSYQTIRYEPAVGQTWSVMSNTGGIRVELKIVRIALDRGVMRAFGEVPPGRTRAPCFDVSTLRRGLRGARIIRDVDGTPIDTRIKQELRSVEDPVVERPRRVVPPRGAPKAEVITMEQTRILQMRARGLSRTQIGQELGLSETQVQRREEQAKEIRQMQRLRAAS